MNHLNVIGIDLAKRTIQVCIIHGSQRRQLVNKAVKANDLLTFLGNQPSSIIAMAACAGAHF